MTELFAGPPMAGGWWRTWDTWNPFYGTQYMWETASTWAKAGRILMLIAIVMILALAFIGILSLFRKTPEPLAKSPYTGESRYSAELTDRQRAIIGILVNEIAPRVQGTRFDKASLDRLLGDYKADFDQVMYFNFRKQLMNRTLSVTNMANELTKD